VLGASPNEILADTSKAARQRPINAKILRRVRRLENLPEPQQPAVLKLLDGIIAAHATSGRAASRDGGRLHTANGTAVRVVHGVRTPLGNGRTRRPPFKRLNLFVS
jgi:hypothetical protein